MKVEEQIVEEQALKKIWVALAFALEQDDSLVLNFDL